MSLKIKVKQENLSHTHSLSQSHKLSLTLSLTLSLSHTHTHTHTESTAKIQQKPTWSQLVHIYISPSVVVQLHDALPNNLIRPSISSIQPTIAPISLQDKIVTFHLHTAMYSDWLQVIPLKRPEWANKKRLKSQWDVSKDQIIRLQRSNQTSQTVQWDSRRVQNQVPCSLSPASFLTSFWLITAW